MLYAPSVRNKEERKKDELRILWGFLIIHVCGCVFWYLLISISSHVMLPIPSREFIYTDNGDD